MWIKKAQIAPSVDSIVGVPMVKTIYVFVLACGVRLMVEERWRGHSGLMEEHRYEQLSIICILWMLSFCLICFMYILELISFHVLFMDLFNWLQYIYISQQRNSVKQCSDTDIFFMQGSNNSSVIITMGK